MKLRKLPYVVVRLKSAFIIPATFSTESRAILQALKTYGMLVADNPRCQTTCRVSVVN